jgi:hypothetical protein
VADDRNPEVRVTLSVKLRAFIFACIWFLIPMAARAVFPARSSCTFSTSCTFTFGSPGPNQVVAIESTTNAGSATAALTDTYGGLSWSLCSSGYHTDSGNTAGCWIAKTGPHSGTLAVTVTWSAGSIIFHAGSSWDCTTFVDCTAANPEDTSAFHANASSSCSYRPHCFLRAYQGERPDHGDVRLRH